MNLSDTRDHDQEFLEPFIAATRDSVPRSEVDSAAARLRARLPKPAPLLRRWRMAVGALAALAAVALLPVMMPSTGGSAFAEVQAWFSEFRTARIDTRMRFGDSVVTELRVWLDDSGFARIETGPVTHVMDPSAGTLVTVLPGGQVMRVPLEGLDREQDPLAAFEWLDEIRTFQGRAEPLPDSRRIDGVEATGYRLQLEEMQLVLWAARDDNRPLRLEGQLPGGLVMTTILVFDEPLPEGIFEAPAGPTPRAGN